MAGDAPYIVNDTATTTAAPFAHTNKVKQVRIRNRDAANTVTVLVASSNVSAAAAKAAVTTGTGAVAVPGADDNWTIPPGQSAVVWKSNGSRFVAFSIISSATTAAFVSEGSIWKD